MFIFLFFIPFIKTQDESNLLFGNENGSEFDFQKCSDTVSCITMERDCEPGTSNCGLLQWVGTNTK